MEIHAHIATDENAVPATIIIDKPIPEFNDCNGTEALRRSESLHKKDADEIYDAIKRSLPQGTRFELVRNFLNDSKNLYRGL